MTAHFHLALGINTSPSYFSANKKEHRAAAPSPSPSPGTVRGTALLHHEKEIKQGIQL